MKELTKLLEKNKLDDLNKYTEQIKNENLYADLLARVATANFIQQPIHIYYLHMPDNKYNFLKYGCEFEASTSIIRLLQSRPGEYDAIKEINLINTPKLKELMGKILSKETQAIKKHYSDKIKNTNENGSSDLFKDIIKDVSDSF